MSKIRKSVLSVVAGLAAFLFVVSLLLVSQPAGPSYADTVPTPAAVQHEGQPYLYVNFFDGAVHIADTASSAIQLPAYKTLDIQYTTVHTAGEANTMTLKLQWSNDNTNWSDGPTIASANAASGDSMVQVTNMGRYARIYNDVTNTNQVTVTVKALAH